MVHPAQRELASPPSDKPRDQRKYGQASRPHSIPRRGKAEVSVRDYEVGEVDRSGGLAGDMRRLYSFHVPALLRPGDVVGW